MEKQNLQAENQTNETMQPIIKEKSTLSTRVLFLKNNWKKLVILAAVGIVVVGIIISAIVGVIAISRNIKANNIKKQLNGMTFHRLYGSSYGTDYWYADTWSFEEDGKYIRDDYNYTVSNDDYHKNVLKHDISEGVAEIKVPLFGTPTINTHYEIVFDEFGNIAETGAYVSISDSMSSAIGNESIFSPIVKFLTFKQ